VRRICARLTVGEAVATYQGTYPPLPAVPYV
jgi:hypothetical protein